MRAALPAATETMLTTRCPARPRRSRARPGEVDAIYVFGGDGTFNEVLNGIARDAPSGSFPEAGRASFRARSGSRAIPRRPPGGSPRAGRGASALGRVNGRRFGFDAGLGLDAELVRAGRRARPRPDGRRPGDMAFAWTASRDVLRGTARLDRALEVEGHGRAAFVLVANCSPYTLRRRVCARAVAGRELRGRARPGRSRDAAGARHPTPRPMPRSRRPGSSTQALYAHDVDRLEIGCDRPLPLQADGEDAATSSRPSSRPSATR